MQSPSEVTLLPRRVDRGEAGSADELFEVVYGELRRVAGQLMHGERKSHTLQATALVHEVWIRLLAPGENDQADGMAMWEGGAHFLRAASLAMRNLLVDHARARTSQ